MKLSNAFKKQISEFSELSVNTIRLLSVEAIAAAKSGHTGIALGAAPIMYVLLRDHLNVNPNDPYYFNRDRFVLSAGHGSAMLYASMLVAGFDSISMEDLKKFRQLDSKCPGHPENYVLPSVDIGTGPLGQGIAIGVGMAIAEYKLSNKFNRYGKFIDHRTYVLFGDGCLQEGVAQEAIAIAGRLKLNKLIMLYDSNKVQLDSKVASTTNFNVKKMFQAYGWNYIKVNNANNTASVSCAIELAKRSDKPTVIECNSIIGFGSRLQNTNAVHGVPLTTEQIQELRDNLNYKIPPFVIHPSVFEDMKIVKRRGVNTQREFNLALQRLESKDINLYKQYIDLSRNQYKFSFDWYSTMAHKEVAASRAILGEALQPVVENNDTFIIGAADLTASTLVTHKKSIAIDHKSCEGQNLYYGVREFAMTCINTGITVHGGCRAITSTFLSFSDYCKNAIRLAAINHVPIINVFSHDTITVGEDGPTHQPIEQIPTLRLIPNHFVFRPANLIECEVALEHAIQSKSSPTTIITSRGNFKQYDSNVDDAKRGGYVIKPCDNHQISIIATGSEVAIAMDVVNLLSTQGIKARLISMPSVELFEAQEQIYKSTIIDNKPIVSIEYASTTPWYKYADLAIGIDEFGKSGKPDEVVEHFNLTPKKISEKILDWFKTLKN